MKVLIIGQGGREHAIAWKIATSMQVTHVFVAPGNAGTALENKVTNIDIPANDIPTLLQFAQQHAIDLTVVGPEQALVNGIVDAFEQANLAIFGPTAKAAMLEGSKSFCKDFLTRYQIPTAPYQIFDELAQALAYLEQCTFPLVVKADGLAAGKGVMICQTKHQAHLAIHAILTEKQFGDAGSKVLIESFLSGEEASFIVMVDKQQHYIALASSQDHKRLENGDKGPNTGGMGAYSPAPVITDTVHQRILTKIIEPTLHGLQAEGIAYQGFLYAGLMIDAQGQPYVIEFNCRLGDPETQPILLRMQSDFFELCQAGVQGTLDRFTPAFDPRSAVGVVLASRGYPQQYATWQPIQGLQTQPESGKIFHAGTRSDNQRIVTSGGRVLCVCALGDNVSEAQQRAYAAIQQITWPDMYYRQDIAHRAING